MQHHCVHGLHCRTVDDIETRRESFHEAYSTTNFICSGLCCCRCRSTLKFPTKDNLADLRTKLLPVERRRCLCELHCMQSSAVCYNIQAIMQHDYHAQLAPNYRMNRLHDCLTLQPHSSVRVTYLPPQTLHYMSNIMIQTLSVRSATCYSGLCHSMFVCAAISHYGREASRPTTLPLVSTKRCAASR